MTNVQQKSCLLFTELNEDSKLEKILEPLTKQKGIFNLITFLGNQTSLDLAKKIMSEVKVLQNNNTQVLKGVNLVAQTITSLNKDKLTTTTPTIDDIKTFFFKCCNCITFTNEQNFMKKFEEDPVFKRLCQSTIHGENVKRYNGTNSNSTNFWNEIKKYKILEVTIPDDTFNKFLNKQIVEQINTDIKKSLNKKESEKLRAEIHKRNLFVYKLKQKLSNDQMLIKFSYEEESFYCYIPNIVSTRRSYQDIEIEQVVRNISSTPIIQDSFSVPFSKTHYMQQFMLQKYLKLKCPTITDTTLEKALANKQKPIINQQI